MDNLDHHSKGRISRFHNSILSFFTALQASAAFGRGSRSWCKGNVSTSMHEVQTGLTLLAKSCVNRTNPHEGSVLASLTLLAEEIAVQQEYQGASVNDLIDTINFLKSVETDLKPGESKPELCEYIPFLENRLSRKKSG